jgi:hypothetical protein
MLIGLPTGLAGLLLALVGICVAVAFVRTARAARAPLDRLRGLRGWHVVTDVAGTDAVVVTPRAVLAITTERPDAAARDLDGAEKAAHRVRELVHTLPSSDVTVVPVIWVDGPDARRNQAHRVLAGVHVVDGTDPSRWLHVFGEERVDGRTRYQLAAAFERCTAGRGGAPRRRRSVGLLPPPEVAGAA